MELTYSIFLQGYAGVQKSAHLAKALQIGNSTV